MVVSWIFLSQIVFSEEYKINNFVSLNVTLLNKEISLEEPQIINFLLSDKSLNNKTDNYGIINGIDENRLRIIKAGMPMLLLTMDPEEMDKNSNLEVVSLNKIRKSRGAYAIQQNGIWYI